MNIKEERNICLLNDSFYPEIDGVVNVVDNYAREIEKGYGHAMVVTPEYPGADDSALPYPVYRFPALDTRKQLSYMTGLPFSPEASKRLSEADISLMHVHCPTTSAILARGMRRMVDVPLIMTYHTKFDIDIANVVKLKLVTEGLIDVMIENISAYDEVWAVSRGAGESLKKLGYKGDYVVMENGVDLPRERKSDEEILKATSGYDLPADIPVFLFVGRLMWYKGFKVMLDALAGLKSCGVDFRMVIIGGGSEGAGIIRYAAETGIGDRCIFTGPVHDREILRCWYSRADLFLFPSTFDTNGLVVREAAAAFLPTVLIRGSCAAEGVTDGKNAYLIDETPSSLAVKLCQILQDRNALKQVGERAGEELYISWEQAVKKAEERYEIVLDNYRRGMYPKHLKLGDELLGGMGEFMEGIARVRMMLGERE